MRKADRKKLHILKKEIKENKKEIIEFLGQRLKYEHNLLGNMENKVLLNVAIKEEPEGGYSVVCTDLDVASQGETIDEALKNIKEAVELYIESAEELGIMDEVLEKLNLTKDDLKEDISVPRILKTEIPVKLAA